MLFRSLKINSVLGTSLNKKENMNKVNIFVDSFDEGAGILEMERERRNKIVENYLRAFQQESEKKGIIIRLFISCRSDFIYEKSVEEDGLSIFGRTSIGTQPVTRFIAPFSYNDSEDNTKLKLVEYWIEKYVSNPGLGSEIINKDVIINVLKKRRLWQRMETGFMFNLIMAMVLRDENGLTETKELNIIRSKAQIYKETLETEILKEWNTMTEEQRKKIDLWIRGLSSKKNEGSS